MLKFETKIGILPHLKLHYILVPKTSMAQLEKGVKRPYLCEVNDAEPFSCELIDLGGGACYIALNPEQLTEFTVKSGDVVQVTLQRFVGGKAPLTCTELDAELLAQPEAKERFEGLKKGMQRYIIYYIVNAAETTDKTSLTKKIISNLLSSKVGEENYALLLAN